MVINPEQTSFENTFWTQREKRPQFLFARWFLANNHSHFSASPILWGKSEEKSKFKMGNSIGCIQSDIIATVGQQVMNDFFSKNFFGQLVSALSASRSCDMPIDNGNLRNYMRCQFLRPQKEAYEMVFILILVQFLCIVMLGTILYGKIRRVVNEIR